MNNNSRGSLQQGEMGTINLFPSPKKYPHTTAG